MAYGAVVSEAIIPSTETMVSSPAYTALPLWDDKIFSTIVIFNGGIIE
jgi:hypothetical protein